MNTEWKKDFFQTQKPNDDSIPYPAFFQFPTWKDGLVLVPYDAVDSHLNILDEAASHGRRGGGHLVGAEQAWAPAQHGQPLVRHVVHRPEVGGPVGVAQAPVQFIFWLW